MATVDSFKINEYLENWTVTASADNAAATAEKAAATGKKHYVAHVSGSFSVAKIKLLQIKDGATVIWEGYVHNALTADFPVPLPVTKGNAVSAVLAAAGTAGEIGKVNISGFTITI